LAQGHGGTPVSKANVGKFSKYQRIETVAPPPLQSMEAITLIVWARYFPNISSLLIDGHNSTTSIGYESGLMEGHPDGLAFPTAKL
jgi:hypothetical protein